MSTRKIVPLLCGACIVIAWPASRAVAAEPVARPSCESRSPLLEALGDDYYRLDDPADGFGHTPPSAGAGHVDGTPSAHGVDVDVDVDVGAAPRRLQLLLERLHAAPLAGGEGERLLCSGPPEARRRLLWLFDLEQLERVATLDGGVQLNAFEARHSYRAVPADDRRVDDVVKAETISLPLRGHWRANAEADELRAGHRVRRLGASSAFCALTRDDRAFAAAESAGLTAGGAIDLASGTSGGKRGSPSDRCTYVAEIALTARADGDAIELEQSVYVNGVLGSRVLWRLES